MDLLKELKELGTQLENKRQNILREVENAAEIYKDDILANFKFEKQQEYSNLADEYEEKKNEVIEKYVTNLWAGQKTAASKEELAAFNEICNTLDNIGSFSEFELNAVLEGIKDNIILMGMAERKIEIMNVVPEGVEVYNHFEIFKPIQEKRKSIRGIDEVRKFKDDNIFSHVLQNSNFDISWSVKMNLLSSSII